MTMSGEISEHDWSVLAEVEPGSGGFICTIHVDHADATGTFAHRFQHFKVFGTECEAVFEGLREGIIWIAQNRAHSLHP